MAEFSWVCVYYIFFIHSSGDGHWGGSHVLGTVSDATWIWEYRCLFETVISSPFFLIVSMKKSIWQTATFFDDETLNKFDIKEKYCNIIKVINDKSTVDIRHIDERLKAFSCIQNLHPFICLFTSLMSQFTSFYFVYLLTDYSS